MILIHVFIVFTSKKYALFLLERYLQLKIKAVKAEKSIELKTVDDFIN